MSFIWFALGFACGALVAPGVILFLIERYMTVPMEKAERERHCPPCDGNCRQGRNCPAGKVKND